MQQRLGGGRLVWKRFEGALGQAAVRTEVQKNACVQIQESVQKNSGAAVQEEQEEHVHETVADISIETDQRESTADKRGGAANIGEEQASTDAARVEKADGAIELVDLGVLQIPFSYGEDAEAQKILRNIFGILPGALRAEIEELSREQAFFCSRLSEITVRTGGVCCLRLDGRLHRLSTRVDRMEMETLLRALTHGAIYAYHDRIRRGYLTPPFGGRVGVVGVASVENGAVSAVNSPSTFVFRIVHGRLSGGEQLAAFFRRQVRVGWLLLSAPGVGKTSALRALARALSIGDAGVSCVAVDERGEFLPCDREGRTLDLLSGYPRAVGMEIALRTLGAEVVLLDEIGSREDEQSLRQHLLAGVPIVATAHAGSIEEAVRRPLLSRFLSIGAFDAVSLLSRCNGGIKIQNYAIK